MRCLAVRIRHRRNKELVPEQRAVFTVVAQHRAYLAIGGERLPDQGNPLLIAVVALQQAAVLTDHLGRVIARNALESRVHVFDQITGGGRPGDQDRVHARIERAALQPQREISALAFGDVRIGTEHADHAAIAIGERQLARHGGAVYTVDHQIDLKIHLRHARADHLDVVRPDLVGERPPRQVVIGLAYHLLRISEPGVAGERHIAAQIARFLILPEDSLRDIVDHRFEHLVRALRLGFGIDLLGDVIGQHKDRRTAHVGQVMIRNVGADGRAVLAPVMPHARHDATLHWAAFAAREVRFEAADLAVRPDRANRHAEEFALRIAVLLRGGGVDREKTQRLAIEDVHRHRVGVEQAAKALVVAAQSLGDPQPLACRALAGAERIDQERTARQHRDDQEQHGVLRLPVRLRQRRLQCMIFLLPQRCQRGFHAAQLHAQPRIGRRRPGARVVRCARLGAH